MCVLLLSFIFVLGHICPVGTYFQYTAITCEKLPFCLRGTTETILDLINRSALFFFIPLHSELLSTVLTICTLISSE